MTVSQNTKILCLIAFQIYWPIAYLNCKIQDGRQTFKMAAKNAKQFLRLNLGYICIKKTHVRKFYPLFAMLHNIIYKLREVSFCKNLFFLLLIYICLSAFWQKPTPHFKTTTGIFLKKRKLPFQRYMLSEYVGGVT